MRDPLPRSINCSSLFREAIRKIDIESGIVLSVLVGVVAPRAAIGIVDSVP
jgi:hypothetical protein